MSRTNYPMTSARQSAERLSLIKIDEIIGLLLLIVQKLDNDGGVADTDYAAILASLKTMRESIGLRPEDFKI